MSYMSVMPNGQGCYPWREPLSAAAGGRRGGRADAQAVDYGC